MQGCSADSLRQLVTFIDLHTAFRADLQVWLSCFCTHLLAGRGMLSSTQLSLRACTGP